jgi:ectoine hydroxylase-related dioxygenase (phytanoyl-CoA dioxygenase family)
MTAIQNNQVREDIDRDGFALCKAALDNAQIEGLLRALSEETDDSDSGARRKGGALYARRNLLDVAAVRELARSERVRELVTPILGEGCFAVRGILFDKTPEANWKVVWHQDLSIAVQEKRDAPGFGPWSEKAGVTHVQPPIEILERMLAVRLHLDACDETNGPLRVLAGSHRRGRLDAAQISAAREATPETVCLAPRGGALLMRPLLLHASSPATVAAHRRVLHLEWAGEELPHGLMWHNRV